MHYEVEGGQSHSPEKNKGLVTGPLVACIDSRDSVEAFTDFERRKEGAEEVVWSPPYTFSSINEKDKFSIEYQNCTGIVAVGVENGKNISFLTHQYTGDVIHDFRTQFTNELTALLKNFKDRVDPETIDISIVGGKYDNKTAAYGRTDFTYAEEYEEVVLLIREIVHDVLGIYPHIVAGPIKGKGDVSVLVVTKERQLHMTRPEQTEKARDKGFSSARFEEETEGWK